MKDYLGKVSGGQDSPKSTVKVAPIGNGRGAINEFAKLREDMQDMFTHFDQKIPGIQKLDGKFYTISEEFRFHKARGEPNKERLIKGGKRCRRYREGFGVSIRNYFKA